MATDPKKIVVPPSSKKEDKEKKEDTPSALPANEGQVGNFFDNHPGGNPPLANRPSTTTKK